MTWAPSRRPSSSTLNVPVVLATWLAMGATTERGTDGIAARWTMAAAPAPARPSASESRIEPTSTATSRPARLAWDPVDRSSITTTSWPSRSSRRTRLEPMNPAPPVTWTRIAVPPIPKPLRATLSEGPLPP